jgi:DNA-directed RNA polymerase II subunit RPB7
MRTYLKHKLLSDVEGTCSGQYGYIICVLDHQKIDIGAGKIVPGVGLAEFTVNYQAIIFKPFKGEVVDATVTTVNKVSPSCDRCSNSRWASLLMSGQCKFLYPSI